ncbi:nacht and ankyrin domain protein [Diplodia corticola]|uniref:Nacht and ankyrin domain protein n=1 Tax=Diplodia corticola TaxID=236234 RepID=A0A1J9RJ38_9PEZI|nr:nacht and ankyrin domain protein [Diplodia corticola]OJD40672.1 nacht and ankyrin domain protein [Diplodia corticola]
MFSEVPSLRQVVVAALLFSIPFQFSYFVTWLLFFTTVRSKASGKKPPTLPYCIPILGSVVSYVADPLKFITTIGANEELSPLRIKLFTQEVVLLRGSGNIEQLWRQSRLSSSTAIFSFVLSYMFGMGKRAARRYQLDDSGANARPHPDSRVLPHNRIDYRTHQGLHQFLLGSGLAPLFDRFQRLFSARLARIEATGGTDGEGSWVEKADFFDFMALELTPATITAMCGPTLLRLSPDFPRLFWEYNEWIPAFSKGLPRLFIPKAYAVRDGLLESIKAWHRYATRETSKLEVKPAGEEDPFWGSKFFRDRQSTLLAVDDYDEDAIASEDFGSIWGFNTNAILASIWATLDVFRDPELLGRVRREVEQCSTSTTECGLDMDELQRRPLLQAVCAETLRLRVHVYISRYAEREELNIGGDQWSIPPKSVVLVSTTTAHLDEGAWNTGRGGRHPVDAFWADRFLVVPGDDEKYGPMKAAATQGRPAATAKRGQLHRRDSLVDDMGGIGKGTVEEIRFAGDSVGSGSLFPFGGGARMCPGRHFAKREMLLTMALMVRDFDVEVTADSKALEMGWKDFGLGTQRPKGRVPFRLRRRRFGVALQVQG